MPKKDIVTGQQVDPKKQARARELRQSMTPAREAGFWSGN